MFHALPRGFHLKLPPRQLHHVRFVFLPPHRYQNPHHPQHPLQVPFILHRPLHLLQRPSRHPRQRLLIRLLRCRRPATGQHPDAHLLRPPADLFIGLPLLHPSTHFPTHFSHLPPQFPLMVPPHAA